MDSGDWARWVGQVVVVDTDSEYLYLGTLDKVLDHFIVLKDADAHDRRESPSTKEQYTMDSKRFGVKVNRKEIQIRIAKVVSFSRLEDVVLY